MDRDTIVFCGCALQGLAAAVYLGKETVQWLQARRTGEMKPLTVRHPFWLLGLVSGCLLTAALGFRFVFHPPQAAPPSRPAALYPAGIPSLTSAQISALKSQPPRRPKVINPPATPSSTVPTSAFMSAPTKQQPVAPGSSSVGTVDCGLSGNCAGINNGTQQTNYGVGEPPPTITSIKMSHLEPANGRMMGDQGSVEISNHPGRQIELSLSGRFVDPMFLVQCDRPCFVTGGGVWPGASFAVPLANKAIPNMGVLSFSEPSVVQNGQTVSINVRSADLGDISVTSVAPYAAPHRKD